MKSYNKVAEAIKPSGIRKFFDIVSEMPDAISLGVGEPDFDTPWHVRDEGIYALEKGRTFYTSNSGLAELRAEICSWYKRYDVNYNPRKSQGAEKLEQGKALMKRLNNLSVTQHL